MKEMQLGYAGKGISEQDKSYELQKIPIMCPHCRKANAWDAEVCGFCSFALSHRRQVGFERYKQRIKALERDRKQIHTLIKELIKKLPQSK